MEKVTFVCRTKVTFFNNIRSLRNRAAGQTVCCLLCRGYMLRACYSMLAAGKTVKRCEPYIRPRQRYIIENAAFLCYNANERSGILCLKIHCFVFHLHLRLRSEALLMV